METPKKYSSDQRPSFVQESLTVYESKQEILLQKNTPEQEILLKKLLKLGCEQIERGETTPHEEVMAEMKLRFNLKR